MMSSLHFIVGYINKKRWFLVGYLALLFESITPIIALLLQRDLIDNVFINKQYEDFTMLIVLYAIFFFGPKLWFTVRKVVFFHISYHLQMTLTNEFLVKIYDLPAAVFNKEHVGKLLNHIRNDIAEASDLSVNKLLSETVKIVITIIFLSIAVAKISLAMLLVVTVVAIVYYILLHVFGEKTKRFSQNVKEEKANVSITIEESISAVREIVAYNRQEWQFNHFEKKFSDYFGAIIKQSLFKIKILLFSEPFLYGTKLIVILIGGMSVISNKISLGEFVVSFTLANQLVTELGLLFEQALTGKRFVASVECIQSVMGQNSETFGSLDFSGDIQSIQLKDVTFSYRSDIAPVLSRLSLDMPIGKKIAIVGESGSGKSTIAQLLLRSYTPDNGELSINNVSVNLYGNQYTDKVSVVFQQPHFIPSSIIENLVFDKEYEQAHIEDICKQMLCHDFINTFELGYNTEVSERGSNLSGGQKQRLALARALLKNTDILILDEATSALDTETEYIVQKNIDEIRKGKTTIVIAHRMSTIQNADIIIVLDKGQVIAQGTHGELINDNQVYRKMYETQKVG